MELLRTSRVTGGVVALALALLAFAADAAAQGPSVVSGSVRDDAGGAVPGAAVSLVGDARVTRSALTDAQGRYLFDDVPPGRYQVVVDIDGFAPATSRIIVTGEDREVPAIVVRIALDQRVEVVGSLEDFRRITGLSPVGLTLGPEHLEALPSDPDVMLHVLRELSAASGRADEVTVYVDGQPISGRLPPKEAIQSIRISTNSFASEFAEPSAGLVEIVTKPAATAFRGEWQGTFSDAALDARNFFDSERRPARTISYSGYVGGPVVPGRWSFLAYGGRWQRDERTTVNATIVDPASFAAMPFVESVMTPSRIDSYSLRTDVVATAAHLFSIDYARTDERVRNGGLASGLDLPERGVDRTVREDTARLSAVSTFGPFVSSEFRMRARRRSVHEAAVSSGPAVLVLDAFNAGGNQAALQQDVAAREGTVTQIVSFADELQTIRGGVQVDLLRQTERRLANQAGTFVFGALVNADGRVLATPLERYAATLRGVPGYGPSSFSMARGAPAVRFDDWQVAWFVQDDIKHTDNVTLSAGVRHGVQKHAHRTWQDIAPRLGIGWTPGGTARHVVRFATGLFYSRLPPDITLDPLRYDGVGTVEVLVDEPRFFEEIPAELAGVVARPAVRLKDDRVRAPLTASATGSYEWQVTSSISASVGYTFSRGFRLLRTRNVNAPDAALGSAPFPERGPMLQFESTGRSESREFRATVRRALTRVSLFGTYVFGSAFSNTDGPYTTIADAANEASDYGRAGDNERHRLVIGSWIGLPGEFSVSTFFSVGSGRPFDITSGLDTNGDLLFLDRPSVAGPDSAGPISTPFGDFNLRPRAGEPTIRRNAGDGPAEMVFNVGVSKTVRFDDPSAPGGSATPYASFGISAANIINRVNFADFNGVVTSPRFGQPNRALNPRRVELSARFAF